MQIYTTRFVLTVLTVFLAVMAGPLQAGLKGTNTTFASWDETGLQFVNSNTNIAADGKWHPFFATLEFDATEVDPNVASDLNGDGIGPVQCSTTDTDGNGISYVDQPDGTAATKWAGFLVLSLDHRSTGATSANGFLASRCWELAVCDRETNGTGSYKKGDDLSILPRYKRFTIDVTGTEAVCETPSANADFGHTPITDSFGFITLLRQDEAKPCSTGNCAEQIDTALFINLDRDCDGTIDYDASGSGSEADSQGNLNLLGFDRNNDGDINDPEDGGVPLPATSQSPQVCFFAQGKKPDFLAEQWDSANIQARITGGSSSGDKTVNHNVFGSAGDGSDLPGAEIAEPGVTEDGTTVPFAYPPAWHVTNAYTGNPYLGGAPDNDTEHFFSLNADGDDLIGTNDENGVVLDPAPTTDINGIVTFNATVTGTNPSAVPSQVCGWFDFDKDGVLGNAPNTSTTTSDPDYAARTDTGERSCLEVPAGTSGTQFPMTWTIPESARGQSGQFYFRFRIANDPDMFDSALLAPGGGYDAGEVEDYRSQDVGTLPVSISSFNSRYTKQGLELAWATVSETHNLGFHVWGDKGNGLEQLNAELIPAGEGDAVTPRTYTLVIPGVSKGEVENLAVTAIDYRGDEEVYGLFEAGAKYGQKVTPAPIPWQEVRQQAKMRGQMLAAERKRMASVMSGGKSRASARYDYVDVRVTEPGLQEISWQTLADAGLDLNGVAAEDIAVTLKGKAVSRHVVDANSRRSGNASERGLRFGPGNTIRFWGIEPTYPDALYLDEYVYRISINGDNAIPANESMASPNSTVPDHLHWVRQNVDAGYNFGSPLKDPWYAAVLRADRSNAHQANFEVDDQFLADKPARVRVKVGGFTDYAEAPDHHVRLEVNGTVVGETMFDGKAVKNLDYHIPAGVLRAGSNTVRVIAPGGTSAPYDMFAVDTVALGYTRRLSAYENRLTIEDSRTAEGFSVTGISGTDSLVYAWNGESLTRLQQHRQRNGEIVFPALADDSTSYWVSSADRVARPSLVTAGHRSDPLAGKRADFIVIAHPAFMPVSAGESHPLNSFIRQRRVDGWDVELFDITEIQTYYGHGMPLPRAVTRFLATADKRFNYEHVLLVGGDSSDYTDNLGLGSISFIPTLYAPTTRIPHTPSDALMADIDGDGVADKAVGRWPVRTAGDLEAIVAKTLEWPNIGNPQSALWVTDSEDRNPGSFRDQAERMIEPLMTADWSTEGVDRVFFDEVSPVPGKSIAATARAQILDSLKQGRSLTGFVGHGSPGMWTFQGLLRPDDISDLYNEGNPTLISTMACYTSYFVSPTSDSLAHRFMNGYRENAMGQRIEGVANGAVAIHGAATLSNYSQNEVFARNVLDGQLQGMTLGQAVEAARRHSSVNGIKDLVINWTLLGDPTIQVETDSGK